jgi:hypothetical protein
MHVGILSLRWLEWVGRSRPQASIAHGFDSGFGHSRVPAVINAAIARSKIKKEPNQEPMLPDFGLRPATLGEETAGQSLSGDGQPRPWLR